MRIRGRLVAAGAIAVAIAIAAIAAASPPGPPSPEDLVGTWRGAAAWKGCTVDGNRRVEIPIHYRAGQLLVELAGARDDLGTVTLLPTATGAAGKLHDLRVTLTAGRRTRLTLSSAAGCVATLELVRDGTGIEACDRLLALDDVAVTCHPDDAAGRAAYRTARTHAASWKRLRGAKRRAMASTCGANADKVEAALVAQGCLPAPGTPGSTGVPECDAYLAAMQRVTQCPKLAVSARQAMRDAMGQLADSWRALQQPGVSDQARRAAASACTQATRALTPGRGLDGLPALSDSRSG